MKLAATEASISIISFNSMIGCLLVLTVARNSVILNKNGDLVRVDDSTPISKMTKMPRKRKAK